MLDTVLDVFRVRQYFNALLMSGELVAGMRDDLGFLDTLRRSLVTLPFEHPAAIDPRPFKGRARPLSLPRYRGKRLALVATGGSGALASITGVWKTFEDAHLRPDIVAVCSGSSLFGFPLAAGCSADEVAEFVLSMTRDDYIDVNWTDMAAGLRRGGRSFAGILRGERLEAAYRRLLGDMTLGEMPIPCYAPLWNIEENRVEYVGPDTYPEMPVARAIHAAVSLPLFLDPIAIGSAYWCDGGIVDIFPVRPILDHAPKVDVVLAVNGFYPPDFAGESQVGWRERTGSIFHIASQVRTSQQIELARTNLRLLRDHADVLMISPVPYETVRGVGFYKHFLDRTAWPEFMRAGRREARTALQAWHPRPQRTERIPARRSRPQRRRVTAKR